jgi:hypothetical protein
VGYFDNFTIHNKKGGSIMKNKFITAFLILLVFHSISFAQISSAPASAPSAKGVLTSTSAIPSMSPAEISAAKMKMTPLRYPVDDEVIMKLKNQILSPQINGAVAEVDPSISGPQPAAPPLITNFEGITYTNWIPPDPVLAVGPDYIIMMVNSSWAIYDKNGVQQYLVTLDDWFSNVSPPGSAFDPKVIYDHHAGRWVMLALAVNASSSSYLISVSDDSNPIGNWWNWNLDAAADGSTPTNNGADFPGLGFDEASAVYITSNQYDDYLNGSFEYAKVRILYKSQLYSGSAVSWWDFWNFTNADASTAFTLKPAHTFGTPGVEYFINTHWNGGSSITLWALTNPLGTPPTMTRQATVSIGTYAAPPNAAQPGVSVATDYIHTGDCRTQDVQYRNGHVYTAFTVGHNWGSGTVSAIRYLKINTSTNTPAINVTYGADGAYYYYPIIYTDQTDNIFLVFNRSALSEYVGIRYSGRKTTDTSTQPSAQLKGGEGFYKRLDGINRNRWGDYSGIGVDPSDGTTVWICSEYARDDNTWSTWVGALNEGVPDYLTVNPSNRDVGPAAGSTTFDVSSNVSWTVTESVSWLSVTPITGSGDGVLTVNYDQNTSVNARVGTITVSGGGITRNVTVTQAGVTPELIVTPANRNVGSDAGQTTFDVTSNISWDVSESVSWLTVTPTSGTGDDVLTVNYDQNTSVNARVGTITVSGEGITRNVTVTQAGITPVLTVVPSNQDVSNLAGQTTYNVTSNIYWIVNENENWLTVSPDSGYGDGLLTVNYDENTTLNTRIGTITVSGSGISRDVTLTQSGVGGELFVTPQNRDVSKTAGQTTFDVTSNLTWNVSESEDWLVVSPMTGSGNGVLTVDYGANPSTSERIGTITVSGDGLTNNVTVTQSGEEGHFVFDPTEDYYPILIDNVTMDGQPILDGDEVGVFFRNDNDELVCGGAIIWPNTGMEAWGDDSQTAEKDGFVAGEELVFRLWDASAQQEYGPPVNVTYTSGNGTWGDGPFAQISLMEFAHHFVFDPTEDYYPIIIENVTLDGQPIQEGCEVGVFFRDDNLNSVCGGALVWPTTGMEAWGDDSQTAEKDGFVPGEELVFRLWCPSTNEEYGPPYSVNYTVGDGTWGDGPFAQISLMEFRTSCWDTLPLISGWNWISINVNPFVPAVEDMWAEISCLAILKSYTGFYVPGVWNGIGDWKYKEAYTAYMTCPQNLTVEGECVPPSDPIDLSAGWNWVSYLPEDAIPIETALATCLDQINIVKAYDGFFVPGVWNGIGDMEPGKGYKMHLNQECTLVYPDNAILPKLVELVTPIVDGEPCSHFSEFETSEDYQAILIESFTGNGIEIVAGNELGVFTESGICVGGVVLTEDYPIGLVAWMDNSRTEELDGFEPGDKMVMRYWDAGTDQEYDVTMVVETGSDKFGESALIKVSLAVDLLSDLASTAIPTEYSLDQNYPNPFNPETTIRYAIPEAGTVKLSIYSLEGKLVKQLENGFKETGSYQVNWDGINESGESVSSGIYLYRLEVGNFSNVRKMIFLK